MLETTPQPSDGSASFCVSGHSSIADSSAAQVRLSARGLGVGYRTGRHSERVVAAGLDLELRAGEFVCLLGPNGAGKSTLLRTLAGLQEPLAGHVEIDGRRFGDWRPRELARRLAVVLTDRALPSSMTGFDLVRLGRHPHTPWTGSLSDEDRSAIRSSLESVDASHLASRPLSEMSDGERQKVTIARALAQEADVLVLDEVTAFLDLPRRVEIVRLLRQLAHGDCGHPDGGHPDGGRPEVPPKAIVLATHDLDLALRSADRLWLVSQPDNVPGELRQGIPESLVLDGSFERVFASQGVDFDRRSGSFRLHRRHRGVAWVSGEGLAAEWTRRALDRLGFELDEGAAVRVDVTEGETGPNWRVQSPIRSDPAKDQPHARLDDALAELTGANSS